MFVQQPWDTNNFYEWFGDWITLWETMHVSELEPNTIEMYLITRGADVQQRPFDSAWWKAFPRMGVRFGTKQHLFGDGRCFSRLITVPHGGLSTFTFNGERSGKVECQSSALMASALYLERLFPWSGKEPDTKKTPSSSSEVVVGHFPQTTKQ